MVEVNYYILLVQSISFLIAISILWKIAWKPLMEHLTNRRKLIEDDLAKAKYSRENAIKLEEDYKKKLAELDNLAKETLKKATIEANKKREEILLQAREEVKKFSENAEAELVNQREQIKKELQKETMALAVLLAEKILKETISAEKQKRFISDFMEEIKK